MERRGMTGKIGVQERKKQTNKQRKEERKKERKRQKERKKESIGSFWEWVG